MLETVDGFVKNKNININVGGNKRGTGWCWAGVKYMGQVGTVRITGCLGQADGSV